MGGLLRILLTVGLAVKFWWLVLLVMLFAVAGCGLWLGLTRWDARSDRRRRDQAALVARADEQHAWVLAGDDRGVYGDYRPEET